MEVTESIRKASLEILLLAQLKYKDMYAYEMALEIMKRSDGNIPLEMPVVYPILQRLLSKGYISCMENVMRGNRKTNVYHLEDSGAVYLNEVWRGFTYINNLIFKFVTGDLSDGRG